jgi:hypothetical protein
MHSTSEDNMPHPHHRLLLCTHHRAIITSPTQAVSSTYEAGMSAGPVYINRIPGCEALFASLKCLQSHACLVHVDKA